MKDNLIKDKSYSFALRIVKLYKYLIKSQNEYVLSKQVLRCGTSIGANVEEAIGGTSRKDFVNKLAISYKEARETHYWLRILNDSDYISNKMFQSIEVDCLELCKILYSIIRSSK
ncbi:MAG: four helix bundle protein [Ignavibacteria bacterium]